MVQAILSFILQCCIAIGAVNAYLPLKNSPGIFPMSNQLKLSAALSFVLMGAFALLAQLHTAAPQVLIGG